MRKLIVVLILVASSSVAAKNVAVSGGGRRIVDPDPSSAETNCDGWSYDPMPVRGDDGALSILYSTSDKLANHCLEPLDSATRFGDHIWRHTRNADGTWSGAPIMGRESFDWMSDSAYLAQHPEAIVGHIASPAVVRADGRWYMAFAASVNDANLCAGEHDATNACGSCADPWSYFTLMWAVSDDGVHWTIRRRDRSDDNRAVAASLLWREPSAADRIRPSSYKGITHASLLRDRKYFYLMTQMWTRVGVKEVLFRIETDPESPFGISDRDPEIWNGSFNAHEWVACPDGRVPDWINDANALSVPVFGRPFSSVSPATAFPGYRYIATAIGTNFSFGATAQNNRIEYQLSADLLTWTPAVLIRSAVPLFADGRSYTNSVLTPALAEDGDGNLRLFIASGDGDDDHGIGRDGLRDCSTDVGPTTIFVGSGIYEAAIDDLAPIPTATTLEVATNPVNALSGTKFVVRVTSPQGAPSGTATITGGPFFASVPIVDGAGEVTLSSRFAGDFNVFASFSGDATLWDASRSAAPLVVRVLQIPPPPKRRAARP